MEKAELPQKGLVSINQNSRRCWAHRPFESCGQRTDGNKRMYLRLGVLVVSVRDAGFPSFDLPLPVTFCVLTTHDKPKLGDNASHLLLQDSFTINHHVFQASIKDTAQMGVDNLEKLVSSNKWLGWELPTLMRDRSF
ncbi:hypothetical protein AV530_003042 [Patagioenas fasciata monilis]|uniref:Uncharacterized protein n=1 Tax=Patagioenas fasciata monilis TaxID=372326 RepID=A0A1V4KW17_PATFA|nr:hypothetical protein AV530_003042 [Patagioenas fasciata monilis]